MTAQIRKTALARTTFVAGGLMGLALALTTAAGAAEEPPLVPLDGPGAAKALQQALDNAASNKRFAVVLAAIDAGRLEIRGVTDRPNAPVTLDGRRRVRSNALGIFSYSLTWRPGDCVARLASRGETIEAMVQFCGPEGEAGKAGPEGKPGPMGFVGLAGPRGETGEPGDAGARGKRGPAGEAGPKGPDGPVGPEGLAGLAGEKGATGPNGDPGPQGADGPAGEPGAQGPQGVAGPSGPMGFSGATGAPGPRGLTGPAGAQGPVGPTGSIGSAGATGAAGPAGLNSIVQATSQDFASYNGTVAGGIVPINCQIDGVPTSGGPVLVQSSLTYPPDAGASARSVTASVLIDEGDPVLADVLTIPAADTGMRTMWIRYMDTAAPVGSRSYRIVLNDPELADGPRTWNYHCGITVVELGQ